MRKYQHDWQPAGVPLADWYK